MAETAKPFPPGDYPAVVVGTGPGGIQMSYDLRRLGIDHALLSADAGPGGMFRRFPLHDRLITCSRPHAPVDPADYAYYKYDWNCMVTRQAEHRAHVSEFTDGTNYFPSRTELVQSMGTFTERAQVVARYDCPWQATRRDDDGRFVLTTPDGEYRCKVAVFAIGMTEPWRPAVPGMEDVPHYVDLAERGHEPYRGKRVFIIGKRNSGFELADALLPVASQLFLGSPHGSRPSITTGTPTPPRARYVQPLEDSLLAGGTFVLNCGIERVERTATGYVVHTEATGGSGERRAYEVDEVIAATGFGTPLLDLPALGVSTFFKARLPSQTHFWESTTVPGVYFAGSVTQGQAGLRKYGIPSRSASIGGFRFNCAVQARHIARTHFGVDPEPPRPMAADDVVPYLLAQVTDGPELWHQPSHLARVVSLDDDKGPHDEGVLPLAAFVDSPGSDGVAVAVETDSEGDIHPAVYVARGGEVTEHLLPSHPMHRFDGAEYHQELAVLLKPR
ncbi:MAG TPA: NAD(P)-binding domain-containing protein [Acidimicrobiales bacterium]|nr:NAD(P)-binding domain-containing protein [Acidimicrobiales bacterium]